MRETYESIFAVLSSALLYLIGGVDYTLQVFLIFCLIDIVTGLLVAANGKSQKSENGGLSSKAMKSGIYGKIYELIVIIVAHMLGQLTGITYIRAGACFALIASEGLSIVENGVLLGAPIPEIVKKALEVVKQQGEGNEQKI